MHTKSLKKIALFTLVTTWSVFTSGCISPAIFKAIMGLVDAIFNDATGTKTQPGTGGAGTNLATNNAGTSGLIKTANGTVTAGGQGAPNAQPNAQPIAQQTGSLGNPAQDAGGGSVTSAVASPPGATPGGAPDAASTALTPDTVDRIKTARQQLANVTMVAGMGADFLGNQVPACAGVDSARNNISQQFGTVQGEATGLSQQVDALEKNGGTPANQASTISAIQKGIDVLAQELMGSNGASQLALEPGFCRQVFTNLFAGIAPGQGFTGPSNTEALVGECGQIWWDATNCGKDKSTAPRRAP